MPTSNGNRVNDYEMAQSLYNCVQAVSTDRNVVASAQFLYYFLNEVMQ